MHTDLSIDLETLGTVPGSVITQIGLVAFSPRSESDLVSKMQIHVDPQSAMDVGMSVSWDTIKWWLVQSGAAREELANAFTMSVHRALSAVEGFIKSNCYDGVKVWGNGAGFDVTLLEEAFRMCEREVPWRFREVRDLRTLTDLTVCTHIPRPKPEREHFAVDDADAQARWIRACVRALEFR